MRDFPDSEAIAAEVCKASEDAAKNSQTISVFYIVKKSKSDAQKSLDKPKIQMIYVLSVYQVIWLNSVAFLLHFFRMFARVAGSEGNIII
jgi:hypothetical protein